MSKKIIITGVAGLLSFAGAFGFAWFTQPKPVVQAQDTESGEAAGSKQGAEDRLAAPGGSARGQVSSSSSEIKKAITQEELKGLVFEVRGKIEEYDYKLKDLKTQEQRLQISQNVLKDDIKELNDLRIELASIVATIKEEQNKLTEQQVKIGKNEESNLQRIAATYDKMDTESAGKILADMTTMKGMDGNSGFDDAIKILYYMTDRTRGKLLASLAETQSNMAAVFCQRLKLIVEKE